MRFRLFSTEIYISFPFCAVLCLMLLFDKTGLIIPTLLSVLLHEAGHIFVMYVLGFPPLCIRFIPASVQILHKTVIPNAAALKIALAGPVFNLSVGLCALLNYNLFKEYAVLLFAVINFALGIFNLLPVCGLDGGTVIKILLSKKLSPEKSENTVRLITALFGVMGVTAGVYLYLKGSFNISVFITALYFFVCAALAK